MRLAKGANAFGPVLLTDGGATVHPGAYGRDLIILASEFRVTASGTESEDEIILDAARHLEDNIIRTAERLIELRKDENRYTVLIRE